MRRTFLVLAAASLAAAVSLSACAQLAAPQAAVREARAAYCAGVSAGGRAALATVVTGQATPVINCDLNAPSSASSSPPIVVTIKPGDLVAGAPGAVHVQIPAPKDEAAPSVSDNPPY